MSATTIFTKNHPPNGSSTPLCLRRAARCRVSFLFSAGVAWARFSRVLMHHGYLLVVHAARDNQASKIMNIIKKNI